MRASNKPTIPLEAYIDFVSSHKQLPLTREFLNQIISIHGFRKLNAPKNVLCDAVDPLALVDPSRSTLKSNISGSARLTEEEIIRDLKHLEWLECCVASIQTLNSLPKQQFVPKPKAEAKRKRSQPVAVAEGADSMSSALVPSQSS